MACFGNFLEKLAIFRQFWRKYPFLSRKSRKFAANTKSCGNSQRSEKLRQFAKKSKVAAKIAAANS